MNATVSVAEAIRGFHFEPSDRTQAIQWMCDAAESGISAEFYTGHDAFPETFEVYGPYREYAPSPLQALPQIELVVWHGEGGFNVDDAYMNTTNKFPTMAEALAYLTELHTQAE